MYSWVPDEVQDAILAACRHLLAPAGVAYLSYNVYPGWKAKEIVRDAMLLSARNGASPEQRVRAARGAVEIDRDGEPLVDETEVRKVLAAEVDALPQQLAELGLLRVDDHTDPWS